MEDTELGQESTNDQPVGLVFDGGKKAHLFVVDYGEHMFSEGEWRFRLAMQALREQINQVCCTGDLNELAAVIFVNTGNAKWKEEEDPAECIYLHRELGVMDAEYVKGLDSMLAQESLKNELQPLLGDSAVCNWTDVFFLCQKTLKHSGSVLRKTFINFFTSDAMEIDQDFQSAIKANCDALRAINTLMDVFLIEKEVEENETTDLWKYVDPNLSRISNEEDLEKSRHFKNYALRSTTSLPFILGDGFKFAVGLYYLIKPQGKPQCIPMSSETNERIELRTHYIPKDKEFDENAVQSDELLPGTVEGECFEGEVNFATNIGGVEIQLDREEFEKLRRFDQPGITVIGFKPLRLLKPSHRMSPSKFIYPLDNVINGSKQLYSALLRKCLERQLFILVRYTQKTNTPPQVCALVPQSSGREDTNGLQEGYFYEGFHLIEMPYAEEARDLRANGRYKPPGGIGRWPSASQEQVNAAKEFVAKLTHSFSPDSYFNPVLQRHYKAVETVALDLDVDSFIEEAGKLDCLQPYFKESGYADRVASQVTKFKELCQPKSDSKVKKEEPEEEIQEPPVVNPKKRGRK